MIFGSGGNGTSYRGNVPYTFDDDMGSYPTKENIAATRLVYDIVANENFRLLPEYVLRRLSVRLREGGAQHPCRKCRRMGDLEDQWQGNVSRREWLMRQKNEETGKSE